MTYGYFEFVWFAGLVGFAILVYHVNEEENKMESVLYGALALLFLPFFKIALGSEIWNIVDAVVGIRFILLIFHRRDLLTKNYCV